MRKFWLILFIGLGTTCQAQNSGKVYFIRTTGFQGSLAAFKVFIDDTIVCKLSNKRYSAHEVKSGTHKFMAQFAGTKAKEGAKQEAITIDVEPNKTYYINLILKTRAFANNLYCEEITENTWKHLYSNLELEVECRVK